MQTSILNSGSVRYYLALGEDGKPIWKNAEAFRTAIARQRAMGKKYADILAIPKFNDAGTHVDWYIPFEPTSPNGDYDIVSWNSASEDEKRKARILLHEFESRLEDYGETISGQALTSDKKLFGHFITGTNDRLELPAIHFPDTTNLFIVDGKPVITFWGFAKQGSYPSGKPFDILDPKPVIKDQAPTRNFSNANTETSSFKTKVEVEEKHNIKNCLLHYHLDKLLWWALGALLFLLLLYLLWWLFFARGKFGLFQAFPELCKGSLNPVTLFDDTQHELNVPNNVELVDPMRTSANGVVVPSGELVPASGVAPTDTLLQDDAANAKVETDQQEPPAQPAEVPLPEELQSDETRSPDEPQTPSDNKGNEGEENQATVPPVDPQIPQDNNPTPTVKPIDLDSVVNSDISSLNGTWHSRSGIQDVKTGKPLNISYDFKDGDVKVKINRNDKVTCEGSSKGALQNGKLTIGGSNKAKCSDGTTYDLPSVTCSKEANGKTKCRGGYNGKNNLEDFNMSLYR